MNGVKKVLFIWIREKNQLYEYIIDKICGYLDEKSVIKLSSTCKKYRDIITIKMNMYWYRYYCNRYNINLLKSVKHVNEIERSCLDDYMKQITIYEDRRKLELFLRRRKNDKKYSQDIISRLCTRINNNNYNYAHVHLSVDFILNSAIICCKNNKHIVIEYDMTNYDSSCDYFARCINGKKEKKERKIIKRLQEQTEKNIEETKRSVIYKMADMVAIQKRIEELQVKQIELETRKKLYDSKVSKFNEYVPKIGEERKILKSFTGILF